MTPAEGGSGDEPGAPLSDRASRDVAAGLVLVAVALFALWAGADLPLGTLSAMGAGMLPRSLAVLVGLFGVAIAASGWLSAGEGLGRWSLRGPFFILGSVVVFAATVRSLGLAFAGPLSMLVGCLASHETRWGEAALFSVALTAFCIVLFRSLLGLPIPIAWFL
ncbi:tripartite tricarboxylate transporter TctB family protein [Alsobacter sp. SYSU M60028]|uniref:Tripartite tricarboxylate transporter TctB family protein n=1 Tax=Alsobacter ponti TaxID=2962936 RepID=A0ABT1LKN0_9HYPH|nr:tripartite tricarboxylate transporter TctB family protein [Alsobacter ponti]MCP8940803.1 tripartite tricarboxylate transporter TctB family protein [Alsobacter ponti]